MVRHGWQILIRQKARKARDKVVWRELAKLGKRRPLIMQAKHEVCDTLAGKAEETKVKAGESKDTASQRARELTGTAQQEAGETGRARQEKASHYASKPGETGGQGRKRLVGKAE